jgi:hypothetical protein
MDDDKKFFLDALIDNKGIRCTTFEQIGLNENTYRKWLANDAQFRLALEEVDKDIKQIRFDYLLSKALKKVEEGDRHMIIFLLKVYGKDFGFSEKDNSDAAPRIINISITPTNGREDE